jgi:hypothetical protein
MRRVIPIILLAAGWALGGCGGKPTTHTADTANRSSSAVLATDAPQSPSDTVLVNPDYQRWLEREPLTKCASGQAHAACLRAALRTGVGVEAAVSLLTEEGDPLRYYMRVTPNGEIEMFTDTTEDKFGPREWSYSECRHLSDVLALACKG